VNHEPDDTSQQDLLNPDRALLRFEFVESLIRLACLLYPSAETFQEKLSKFMSSDFGRIFENEEFAQFNQLFGDAYRDKYIYEKEVCKILKDNSKNLEMTLRAFAKQKVRQKFCFEYIPRSIWSVLIYCQSDIDHF
jgi:hypothetical protein